MIAQASSRLDFLDSEKDIENVKPSTRSPGQYPVPAEISKKKGDQLDWGFRPISCAMKLIVMVATLQPGQLPRIRILSIPDYFFRIVLRWVLHKRMDKHA